MCAVRVFRVGSMDGFGCFQVNQDRSVIAELVATAAARDTAPGLRNDSGGSAGELYVSHSVHPGPLASITDGFNLIDFPQLCNIVGERVIWIGRTEQSLN